MLEVKNLSKIFKTGGKETRAIDSINFSIAEGSFVTITGRSGSGKSTLLYQLGLLDRPTEGEVFIDGINMAKASSSERSLYRLKNLGYVFQDYALVPTLNALENVYLPLIMAGASTKKATQASLQSLERVGLVGREGNLPSQLSGGEQQRVSIARAITHAPKILYADEPTANLDSDTADLILKILQDLNKKGQTIIMVTHELEYAKLGNRRIQMLDGKIVADFTN